MSRKPMTKAIWRTMMRRYAVISAIGLVACIYCFYRLYGIGASQAVPTWIIVGASLGGLMLFGGMFGLALSFFFHMWHRDE